MAEMFDLGRPLPPPPLQSLDIKTQPHAFQAEVSQALIGGSRIQINSLDGVMKIDAPTNAWPWLAPGDITIVTISVVRVRLEPFKGPTPLSDIKGLI